MKKHVAATLLGLTVLGLLDVHLDLEPVDDGHVVRWQGRQHDVRGALAAQANAWWRDCSPVQRLHESSDQAQQVLRLIAQHSPPDSSALQLVALLQQGNWLVGGVILLFSVIFPLTKIVLLLELSLLEFLHRRHKAASLKLMEHMGRWSMMDVMLLAFLVMLVKLGNIVQFHFGPAVIAFVLCVAMSMVASISFDPHAIWEDSE